MTGTSSAARLARRSAALGAVVALGGTGTAYADITGTVRTPPGTAAPGGVRTVPVMSAYAVPVPPRATTAPSAAERRARRAAEEVPVMSRALPEIAGPPRPGRPATRWPGAYRGGGRM